MNMMDSPKFRRKRTSATGSARPVSEPPDPVRPLDETAREAARKRDAAAEQARSEAEARRIAEAADKAKAREKAQEKLRRRAELEELARAEALRRVMAARARREAEARKAAERAEAEAALQAEKEAEERRIQAERADEERAAEARRKAAEEKAEAERLAEEEKRAEQVRLAEARAAEDAARRAEEERLARERAEATETVPPLALTGMVPVTEQPASAPASARAPQEPDPVDSAWARLAEMTVDKGHLDRNRIITASRDDPAHAAFDVLRTRLLQALHENGWRRVAITSPGKECGKTFTAANLAISLSRQENCRTLLLDLDMRRPSLHRILGVSDPGSLGDMLRGMTAPGDHLLRMGRNPVNAGRNIAFGLNGRPEAYASELLQDPRAESCLQRIEDEFDPDVVLIDLPPALSYDDVIAARPLFDGVLLVIGGGMTTEKEIAEVERRLGDGTPILGMILNKAEGTELDRYSY